MSPVFFWGGPFSQWHPSTFDLDGTEYSCAEQAMMVLKARLFGDEAAASRILSEAEPGAQKALGRTVRGFDETTWEAEREGIVKRVNLAKYGQNKGLRRKLFQTLGRELVEASPMDTIWGIGLDERAARQIPRGQWPGMNLLGRALMEVREELAALHPEDAEAAAKDAA